VGCNCGGSKTNYQVRFASGSVQVYKTLAEAQAAIAQSGGNGTGSTIKAVAATK